MTYHEYFTRRSHLPASSDESNAGQPNIDVVHVTALRPNKDLHGMSELLPEKLETERTELVFRFDMAGILGGDLAMEAVEEEATRLLHGLMIARRRDAPETKRAIMFVAYDLGAVVVKTAIARAGRLTDEYPGIFFSIAQIVFSGCPQRSLSTQMMAKTLFTFLHDNEKPSWSGFLTIAAAQALADVVLQTSELFINSKITHLRPITSLYSNCSTPGIIHNAMDKFTATLGVSSEVSLEEEHPVDGESAFPSLQKSASYNPDGWVPHPGWARLKQALLSISPPPHQVNESTITDSVLDKILESPQIARLDGEAGVQVLYIYGEPSEAAHDIADKLFLLWRDTNRSKKESKAGAPSVTFDSTDSGRDSVHGVAASILLQATAALSTVALDELYHVLHEPVLFEAGWTDETCMALLNSANAQIRRPAFLLLRNFDECGESSRQVFLRGLKSLAERNERRLRILITSRKPRALVDELQHWDSLDVGDFVNDDHEDKSATLARLTQLCPKEDQKASIRDGVDKLSSMEDERRCFILQVLEDHTGWPLDPSLESRTRFTRLLGSVGPEDTEAQFLDRILRSHPDQEGVRWALTWLLYACRPLSTQELATVMCQRPRDRQVELSDGNASSFSQKSTADEAEIWREVVFWLRGLVDIQHTKVSLRGNIRDIIVNSTDDGSFLWSDLRQSAHPSLASFCLATISSSTTHALFSQMAQKYERNLDEDEELGAQLLISIAPDHKDISFYAAQFLTGHLRHCLQRDIADSPWAQLQDLSVRSLTLWAKINWAMSNPFSRSAKPPICHHETLAGLGLLSYKDIAILTGDLGERTFIAAARSGRSELVSGYLSGHSLSVPVLMEALLTAMKSRDEATALNIGQKVVSLSKAIGIIPSWPQSSTWAASWHNMPNLLELLLSNGASTDPQKEPSALQPGFSPSPLYCASRMGHSRIVRCFLAHGVDVAVRRNGELDSFLTATAQGHLNVVKTFVSSHGWVVTEHHRESALCLTPYWGSWAMAEFLLVQLKMDVDRPQKNSEDDNKWTALTIACHWGHPKTAKVLLENGADPNVLGPANVDTPLWFASAAGSNLECVRMLLEHGADPNHEALKPPLASELCRVASEKGTDRSIDMLNVLISCNKPVQLDAVGESGTTALMGAASIGLVSLVDWLLENGADINLVDNKKRSALFFAAGLSHVDVVKALLRFQPELDAKSEDGDTPLHIARRSPEVLKLLLDAGANPEIENANGYTVLNLAISWHSFESIKTVVERKANIHHKEKINWWSPICDAVGFIRDPAVIRLLAEFGANLRDTVPNGFGLMHLAMGGPPEVLRVLLEFGRFVDINQRSDQGLTPILLLSSTTNLETLKLIIQAGADVHARGPTGGSCLHHALLHDAPSVVSVLLSDSDVDVNKTADQLGSPLQVACQKLRVESIDTLLDHGADIDLVIPYVLWSTVLVAAVVPFMDEEITGEEAAKVDQIVRTLVRRGAKVDRVVRGTTFYTTVAAAAFGAGVATINYLLDESASLQLPDPDSGRIPLHFAAANGVENFQAILLAYRGDVMAADFEGKTSLHWAAQFGNAKTIDFILSRAEGQATVPAQWVNLADTDGWTPLCWLLRPCSPGKKGWLSGIKSEETDRLATIRLLLKYGADPAVPCRLGPRDTAETLTPLDLARRGAVEEEIVAVLQDAIRNGTGLKEPQDISENDVNTRKYKISAHFCDICLGGIFGIAYSCTSCPQIDVCAKCIATVATFHGGSAQDDGKEHVFKPKDDQQEFEDPPTEDKVAADGEAKGEETTTNRSNSSGEAEAEGDFDEYDFDAEVV